MKPHIAALILGAALTAPAVALSAPGDDLADKYFSKNNPDLTAQERAALAIAKRWERGATMGVKPVPGPDGAVRFVYGAQEVSIVCAPMQVCDLALQAGEQVNTMNWGDTVRWNIEPGASGSGAAIVEHLLIKPLDVGLTTSLVVATDRRTYHIKLRSHRTKYMPQVAFVYPEEALAKWDALRSRQTRERHEKTIPQTGEYLGDLSFAYDVDGAAAWKPVRVYNDGRKTIIEMPKAMEQTEAPSLLVVRKAGGLFTDDETVTVNYRLQGGRYIVDAVFDKAILIAGVGNSQDRVTITRRK